MGTEGGNLESGAFYLDRQTQRKHISQLTSYTNNTESEVEDMMTNLKKCAGI